MLGIRPPFNLEAQVVVRVVLDAQRNIDRKAEAGALLGSQEGRRFPQGIVLLLEGLANGGRQNRGAFRIGRSGLACGS